MDTGAAVGGNVTGTDELRATEPVPPRQHGTRSAIVSGLVSGALVAGAVFFGQWAVDDRRSDRELARDRVFVWQTTLAAEGQFPNADIAGLSLPGIYAPGVVLTAAQASGANLSGSVLMGAYLDGADFSDARLDGVQLQRASLQATDLTNASLVGANLRYADLRHATLTGANLTDARLWRADLRGVDLAETELPEGDLDRTCWDENTVWPPGVTEPAWAICISRPAGAVGHPGVMYSMEAFAATAATGERPNWAKSVTVGHGEVIDVLVWFANDGVTPLNDVTLVVDTGTTSVIPGSIVLYKGTREIEYGDEAIQDDGHMINMNLGDFDGRDDAYVEFEVRVDESDPGIACRGTYGLALSAYPAPQDFGSLLDNVAVTYENTDATC